MKITALALLLASGAGCFYDSPNPWNTASDQADYLDLKEQGWLLDQDKLWDAPQQAALVHEEAELEAWRDMVLVHAERGLLDRMREQSASKLSALDGLLRSHGEINENNKEQITGAYRQWRLERRRYQLIEHRLSQP